MVHGGDVGHNCVRCADAGRRGPTWGVSARVRVRVSARVRVCVRVCARACGTARDVKLARNPPKAWRVSIHFDWEIFFLVDSCQKGINDNIMAISIVSTATCTPECANGLCVRNDVCECHAGWIGAACNRRRPNPSSNVYCERNTLLVGERTKCTLVPRYDLGAPVDACPSDFTVTAGASSEVGGPLFESTHEQVRQIKVFPVFGWRS